MKLSDKRRQARLTPCQTFALILVRDKDTYFGALHNFQALLGRNRTLDSLKRKGLVKHKCTDQNGTIHVLTQAGEAAIKAAEEAARGKD